MVEEEKFMNEIEELEKILSEKIENDEEWDTLDIEDVKPRYVGKLQEHLQDLPPQAVVLAILVKYFERFKEPVKITKFTKITFEVDKKVLEPILSKPLLSFKADNFGPFTEEIYDNMGFLQNLDLIEIEQEGEGDKTEFILTEKGSEVFRERVSKQIPETVIKMIETIVDRYGSLSHDELLQQVYNEYPDFADKSLVRDKYL